jgi:DNA anti-recombination protein RmuC
MVVMFVASEAAFSTAVERDPNLLLEAVEKKVVIATPATMVALLQVTALGWREAAYAEGTQRVRELATQLVERLGVLIRHYNRMGRALDATVQAHNEGAGSIESRLLVTGREFGRLGIAGAQELESPGRGRAAGARAARGRLGAPRARGGLSAAGRGGPRPLPSVGAVGAPRASTTLRQPAVRAGTRGRSAYSR